MIKNFIANGASYTEYVNHPEQIIKTWATYLAQELSVENHVNLASSGVGNDYVCHSTINYLEANNLDPKDTLVIVMWPGSDRIDVPISQDWYKHIKFGEYSCCKTDGTSHWISSGGMCASWKNSKISRSTFDNLYRITDPMDLCMQSLRYFVLLESYLQHRGYKFLFTSGVNHWKNNKKYSDLIAFEFNFGYYCKDQPIYKNFDFSNWLFINDKKDCLGEFASVDMTKHNGFHPSDEMHQRFAREIVLPRVQQIHM
jgi:hypothetical protein